MSDLTIALDNIRLGENNHVEKTWSSTSFEELLTQYYFQLVRTKDMKKHREKFRELLQNNDVDNLILLIKLIIHTRDLNGKGERSLTYMMLLELWIKKPEYAYFIFETMMLNKNIKDPYASWKDIKYLCQYIKNETAGDTEHPFISWLIELTNFHLKQDWDVFVTKTNKNISLLAKWIPREKSKFGWLFKLLVKNMFARYYETAKTKQASVAADKKARKEYRIICSTLNKFLDTTQIKQCNNSWRFIDPNNVTSITFSKQKQAFFNQKQTNHKLVERSEKEDRIQCRKNFVNYLNMKKEKQETIKGKRCSIYDFVKDAIKYGKMEDEEAKLLKETINSQWQNNSKQNFNLDNMVTLVDTSGSMEQEDCQPLYNAIGLGIRISEKTTPAFRNRILTFSAEPTWVNLDNCKTFCDKVKKIRKANWGMNTNIYKACELILYAIKVARLTPEDIKNLTLVILSDMQIDHSQKNSYSSNTLYENLKTLFQDAGLEMYGIPIYPPNILFWNLRKTDGFPSQTTENNITMLSGFSPLLLNVFCNKGFEQLKKINPYDMLLEILNNERYNGVNEIRNIML
ncbi:MAG TPA: DUF2828 family protein [Cytophagales bacterium]|nr:DUF2828 family protein [Cytophagales bacterium]